VAAKKVEMQSAIDSLFLIIDMGAKAIIRSQILFFDLGYARHVGFVF
jgi:hypothetical protein